MAHFFKGLGEPDLCNSPHSDFGHSSGVAVESERNGLGPRPAEHVTQSRVHQVLSGLDHDRVHLGLGCRGQRRVASLRPHEHRVRDLHMRVTGHAPLCDLRENLKDLIHHLPFTVMTAHMDGGTLRPASDGDLAHANDSCRVPNDISLTRKTSAAL
jgi:hypothetical protein